MDDYFKPIDGFAGYRVSRDGEVQSCWLRRGRFSLMTDNWFLLKAIIRDGYGTVNLSRCGKKSIRRIHRLVLEAFEGPGPSGGIACHKNGKRLNNTLRNLYWGTHQTNSDDAVKHGTKARGEALRSKLAAAEVIEIRRLRAEEGLTMSSLAGRYGISESNVRAIVNRKTWKHILPHDEAQHLDAKVVEHRGAA